MVQVEPSRGKKSVPTSFICALLHFRQNSAKPVKNRFLLNYIVKDNTFVPNSTYSKWYRWGLVEKNSMLTSFICALLHSRLNSAKPVKIDCYLIKLLQTSLSFQIRCTRNDTGRA